MPKLARNLVSTAFSASAYQTMQVEQILSTFLKTMPKLARNWVSTAFSASAYQTMQVKPILSIFRQNLIKCENAKFLHKIWRGALIKCFAEGATLHRVFFWTPVRSCFGSSLGLLRTWCWALVDRCVKDSTLCSLDKNYAKINFESGFDSIFMISIPNYTG